MTQTIRIEERSRQLLGEIAEREGTTLQEALARAIEHYNRDVFLAGLTADFEALRANAEEWAEERAERAAWETTLADGVARNDQRNESSREGSRTASNARTRKR